MLDEKTIALIADEVARRLRETGRFPPAADAPPVENAPESAAEPAPAEDIASAEHKAKPLLRSAADPEALARMKRRTTARIGVGRAGPRLNTETMLTLRADHAKARDSVFADVDPRLLERLGLFTVQTQCDCKDTYLTRPDLGRRLSDEAVRTLEERCVKDIDVQIYASDGLSSAAIEANLERILPVLTEGLEAKGLKLGTPFFVRFGRVAAEDHIAELLRAKVVCVLIGERPGLATAESMSAYIVYGAHPGIPEAKRTVVSNIHKDGLTAVEAGAYITEVIEQILRQRKSGVDLVK
ncbi:MAG: ethanolamine ammonia-lyase subunit EutC [Ruminococcaceae bacterium]|nr:ethanolamine ammonia-lyase subunit EutC [Oscillospiraceae bacterium]